MQISPSVRLLSSDPTVLVGAAAELSARGCRVTTSGNDPSVGLIPDLVVRDWRDVRSLEPTTIPVLTLDLSLVRGRELMAVVTRALGLLPRRPAPRPRAWRSPSRPHSASPSE